MTFFMKFVSVFMSIFLPLLSIFVPKNNNYKYSDCQPKVKEEKIMTEYKINENDIFISVDGNNSNDGSKNAPVCTLEKAKTIAAIKRNSGITEHINVWISEGTYVFDKKVIFDGNDADDVSYIAIPDNKVVFSGSQKVSEWKPDTLNGKQCFSAEIPERVSFNSVFKNGKTLPQTRYPETGYFRVDNEDHSGSKYSEENSPWSLTRGDLELTPSKDQNIKDFKNPEDVTIRVLHLWVDDFSKLTGYDSSENRIKFASPMSASIEKNNRYYFENVCEAFDKPGEWYLNSKEHKIYYLPFDGENINLLDLSYAITDKLISITNCNNITFEGIDFIETDSSFPEIEDGAWLSKYGLRFPQAEYDCAGVFEATKSTNINIKYCNFKNIGIYAIKFNRICKNCSVIGCNIFNTGAGGIYIHGFNEKENDRITENITIRDNLIDGYGKYFYSAIGILLTHARNCNISNNEICNGYYTAISDGWLWGYAYSVTENNKICNNLIYNIGQGWLSDMGGIYTLGRQKGTILSGNIIHNVAADPDEGGYGGWGIYLDEGSQMIIVEKNLVYDCGSQCFHQHYGENNIIRNNIFALSAEGQATSSFGHGSSQTGYENEETHNEFTYEKNIFLSDNTAIYVKLRNHDFKDDSNIYWDMTNGKNVFCDYYDDGKIDQRIFKKYIINELGLYRNAVFADPGFKDAKNYDFTLPDNNPALEEIGFEKWDYNITGTITRHTVE